VCAILISERKLRAGTFEGSGSPRFIYRRGRERSGRRGIMYLDWLKKQAGGAPGVGWSERCQSNFLVPNNKNEDFN
jgi:hypothetical protein